MKTLVLGVGGAGMNYINRAGGELPGVDTVGVNCDAVAAESCKAGKVLQIGPRTTKGLGAGANLEIGMRAAEESVDEIADVLGNGYDFAVIVCGLGGGTGTGASPVIARIAREMGIFVVGAVSLPFSYESASRKERAAAGLERMKEEADLLLCIPNSNLLKALDKNSTLTEALKLSDRVVTAFIRNILCRGRENGLSGGEMISFDSDELKSILAGRGLAYCGYGSAEGEGCVMAAAAEASKNVLLDDSVGISGASSVIFSLSGDIGLNEAYEAVMFLKEAAGGEPDISFSVAYDESRKSFCEITVVAVR